MHIAVHDGCALLPETDQLLSLWEMMWLEIKDEQESLVEDEENCPYSVAPAREVLKDPRASAIVVLCLEL